ncbi:hypothetical protein BGAPBR_Q0026 (plasmid) [Borreliella garinii PBr]|uniref:Uncharacterized protein n=1 Tax=Borreliella garinii PBr TaxID=498743 RepID=B8F1A3_BORGR|nr:hypothetical protein BGAPBR_Q0026 [Borreliella garinii PBr]
MTNLGPKKTAVNTESMLRDVKINKKNNFYRKLALSYVKSL